MTKRNYSILNPDPTLQSNLMAFWFECGEGWHPMIWELMDKIQDIVDAHPEYADIEVTQIKEKYGGLRVYMNYYPSEIEKLIDDYENRSYTICERCGKPGELRDNHGWYTTLCDDCAGEL